MVSYTPISPPYTPPPLYPNGPPRDVLGVVFVVFGKMTLLVFYLYFVVFTFLSNIVYTNAK